MMNAEPLWQSLVPAASGLEVDREQVGGKALSLHKLGVAGFKVPRALALTQAFFRPWIQAAMASDAWRELVAAGAQPRAESHAKQRLIADGMVFTPAQLKALHDALDWLGKGEGVFAVRSSAPEEDGETASFAGALLSRLNVPPDQIERAIRDGFAALFAPQFLAYRKAVGANAQALKLAMVIQHMVDADVAGVAFSVDPLSNDHDHAVVSAAVGLGENVVAGLTTPDTWTVDTRDGRVVARPSASSSPSLSLPALQEIVAQLKLIEALWQCPVDIEWAYHRGEIGCKGDLYLLQARPMTAYVPLPDPLRTAPGERRRVYLDVALSSGLTMNSPISPLGLSTFAELARALMRASIGDIRADPHRVHDALVHFCASRVYLDLSNVLGFSSTKALANKLRVTDVSLANIVSSLDADEVRARSVPSWMRASLLLRLPALIWRMRGLYGNTLLALLAPRFAHRRMQHLFAALERRFRAQPNLALPATQFWQRYVAAEMPALLNQSMATLGPGMIALQWQTALAERVLEPAERMALQQGFVGNPVVAMQHAMAQLAAAFKARGLSTVSEMRSALDAGVDLVLCQQWQSFLDRFGFRGPDEMDVGQPRYSDDPNLALCSISAMQGGADSLQAHQQQIAKRTAALQKALARSGWLKRLMLAHLEKIVVRFAGWRDLPKHHLLMLLQRWRERAKSAAAAGLANKQLRALDDIRYVQAEELDDLQADRLVRAAESIAQRRTAAARLSRLVRHFPAIIDSRGRILRAPVAVANASGRIWSGVGVSAGVARGPVRIASSADVDVMPGDILVAYVTDPGWTPLFLRTAAVILEVGGMLQHGAVVARELGLPCVIGVDGICAALRDGQMVEVDGVCGLVKLLDERP